MSICNSGMERQVSGGVFKLKVSSKHPLILLSNALPWGKLYELVISDIKNSTKKGQWWRGRKLKVRMHLGVYILQQINNLTDRKMELALRENIVYQIFCGKKVVKGWKWPDHTKIETFRSRLSPKTQQEIANLIAQRGVELGIADPTQVDVDSTIQEANITYPTDAKMLRKLGSLAAKVCNGIKALLPSKKELHVNLKDIASKASDYFFRKKNCTSEEKYALLSKLLESVAKPVKQVIAACKKLEPGLIEGISWNIRRSIDQLLAHGKNYLKSVAIFIETGKAEIKKRLSFHADEVGCFSKDKAHKKYEFGRVFQIARLAGNLLFITKSNSIPMHDRSSLKSVIEEHEKLFGQEKINSLATDKGYYSERNVRLAVKKGISDIGIQVPGNTKLKGVEISKEVSDQLRNRRAGIEPLIGHAKQGGQLGRSRMKTDRNTESSGYTAILGFNLRQVMKALSRRRLGEDLAF